MKSKKIFLFITILLLLLVGVSSLFRTETYSKGKSVQVIAKKIINTIKDMTPTPQSVRNVAACTNKEKIQGLANAKDVHLRKLDEYQIVCNSLAVQRLMLFTDMPNSDVDARTKANAMAATLREYAQYNVTPVVIIEPTTNWGLTDFLEYDSGFYDPWITTYFRTLQQQGITDAQMGIWVPFPEANVPTWNKGNAKPNDYAIAVNKYLGVLKNYFPKTQTSILLNSETYKNDDTDWLHGKYVSLLPYVKNIDPKLVDSFGLQGFAWVPAKNNTSSPQTDPSVFLNKELAIEAAKKLKVKEIWFNTGTFASKYTQDSEKTVMVNPHNRQIILDAILSEAQKTQSNGYTVWLNIFSEDKSQASEQTDWSYWHTLSQIDPAETAILKDFIAQLNNANIGASLYDNFSE